MHLDTSIFRKLKDDYDRYDKMREKVIIQSRSVIKFSKQVIFSIHRNDLDKAKNLMDGMTDAVAKLKEAAKSPELMFSGVMRAALQEYVEAACFNDLVQKGVLSTPDSLEVDTESYLLGVCDLTGELGRSAVHAATKRDTEKFKEIKDFVSLVYEGLLQFDFRNSELRRKFDTVKYTVKKMEDIEFELSKV